MSTKPWRIKLSRRKGYKLQDVSLRLNGLEAVKVDRSTIMGNPYQVDSKLIQDGSGQWVPARSPQQAVEAFRIHVDNSPGLREIIVRLARGKNVACWCELDDACHGDVILEVANA